MTETIFVDESTIDFPIFLLFFNTKFPIFLFFWASMALDNPVFAMCVIFQHQAGSSPFPYT